MIAISVSSAFSSRGIAVELGCLQGRVTVARDCPGLAEALETEAQAALGRLGGDPPSADPAVAATRKAYRTLGKDPARYRPSAEALMRRIQQGKGLYRVNTVVDGVNRISVGSGFSIGAYDVDRLLPPLLFRPAAAGESYAGIGRGPLNLEGLPVLADAEGPFGCPTSDSERTRIGEATREVLLVLFGFGGVSGLVPATELALDTLARYAAGTGFEKAFLRES